MHAARALLVEKSRALAIIEMPLYHLGEEGTVYQAFAPPLTGGEFRLVLDAAAQRQKRAMLDSYRTQRATLAPFGLACECFRLAPRHDFCAGANRGLALYDGHAWGLRSAAWRALAREASRELGIANA